MSVIFLVDGLHCVHAGTAGGGQVSAKGGVAQIADDVVAHQLFDAAVDTIPVPLAPLWDDELCQGCFSPDAPSFGRRAKTLA